MRGERERPISIAMLALGGQGGGVLTNWLVDVAEANGYLAQSTYVAGVAQRTGATVYCVEMFPQARAEALGKEPVFTSYPIPGDVDLVIAGEMAESGRAILKGFVTPNCTTLLASSHRVYSIDEKSALDDGIIDQTKVAEIAEKVSKQFICFDMEEAASRSGSIISAVLLGAIAASEALPFTRDQFEAAIRSSGRAVESNLAGFAAGYSGVQQANRGTDTERPAEVAEVSPTGPNGTALAERIRASLPERIQAIALHGALRVLDYQDRSYADEYLEILEQMAMLDRENGGETRGYAFSNEVGRQLALQMCYEDIVRVAELKTRKSRFERIFKQVNLKDAQPLQVVEYFHPRFEEVCDTLPAWLGGRLYRSSRMKKMIAPLFAKGRNITTTNLSGFLMLRSLAKLKRFRRGSFRFKNQQKFIGEWLKELETALLQNYADGLVVARGIEAVRGYGDTYQRGVARYRESLKSVGADR